MNFYESNDTCPMSEPTITADQAIAWVDQWGEAWERLPFQSEVAALIRSLSARNAELEKELITETERLAEIAASNGKDAEDLECDLRIAQTKIAALESATRWRSCKDEPPEQYKNKPLLTREDFAGGYVYEVGFFASIWTGPFGDEVHPTEWRGLDRDGYGQFKALGQHRAHRVSWLLNKGEISGNLHVLHKCDNRLCVNPAHLFLGTNHDNVKDMWSKGRASMPPNHKGRKFAGRKRPCKI